MGNYYKIHPAIGIARLGDAGKDKPEGTNFILNEDYFLGPEAPGEIPLGGVENPPDGEYGRFKNSEGRVKRQGARFRIYEYNEDGKVEREINLNVKEKDVVKIEWHVRLANKKAIADKFPPRQDSKGKFKKRNKGETKNLSIDAKEQSVAYGGKTVSLKGKFKRKTVRLGHLTTDKDGRLVVLGGFGESFQVPKAIIPILHPFNNNCWCDDTSDGRVKATIHFKNGDIKKVDLPAWVVVAPPDFAPGITHITTLYDIAYQAWRDLHESSPPLVGDGKTVYFGRDIYPLLKRTIQLISVSERAQMGHGKHKALGNFMTRQMLEALGNNDDSKRALRELIFYRLRDPNNPIEESTHPVANQNMPLLNKCLNPQKPTEGKSVWPSLTEYQYGLMKKWNAGDFSLEEGWDLSAAAKGLYPKQTPIEKLALVEQPEALDRAALEACVGSPFHPGIEIGYISALPETYRPTTFNDKFRLAESIKAGELTAGNAVPWQADFLKCDDGWWPAQRPVSTRKDMDGNLSDWIDNFTTHKWLVNNWSKLGFTIKVSEKKYIEIERDSSL